MANPEPDTSGLVPFEKGKSGNPGGKTSEQRKMEIANAESATRLRARMLSALEIELAKADQARENAETPNEVDAADAAISMITANILKLLKDAEDRGLGTPVQSVNLESPNGTMTPQAITRTVIDPKVDADT